MSIDKLLFLQGVCLCSHPVILPVNIRPFGEKAQHLIHLDTLPLSITSFSVFPFFFLVYFKCLYNSNLPQLLCFWSSSSLLSLSVSLSLRCMTDRKWTSGPRSGGCENLTILLMRFIRNAETCRERAREEETEGGTEYEREMEKKAAPPATKLTASRLDICPLVIKEVPDSVPVNLRSKSLFSTVLIPQCPTCPGPPMFFLPSFLVSPP